MHLKSVNFPFKGVYTTQSAKSKKAVIICKYVLFSKSGLRFNSDPLLV